MTACHRHVAVLMHDLRGGGYERMMINLAREWTRTGVAVDLVVIKVTGEYLSLVPEGVRIIDLGTRRTLTSILPLMRYLHRERPRALLSGLAHVNALAAFARTAATRTRIVLSERNTPSRERRSADWATRFGYQLAPWAYQRADAIIAVSEGVADDMAACLSVPRDRVQVICNPVVTSDLHAMAQEPVSHPWLAPNQPPIVLSVGRLARQKDHATLILAFARVLRQTRCRLVILGEGPERPRLEALAAELGIACKIDMPGFSSNPYPFMRRSSLFVLSSCHEGSPNVLVEAMASGVPVIATDCASGPREILCGGLLAPLVKVGDVEGLAEAMRTELHSPRSVAPLVARAADFDARLSAAAYLDVLLAEPRADPVRHSSK